MRKPSAWLLLLAALGLVLIWLFAPTLSYQTADGGTVKLSRKATAAVAFGVFALVAWVWHGAGRRGARHGMLRLAAVVVGWIIPGGGHILLGRTGKGLFFFLVLFLTSVAGLVLADFRAVKFVWDNMFYWVGFFGSGMSLLLVQFGTAPDPKEWMPARLYEVGLLYMTVAGLLNLVVLLSLSAVEETPEAAERAPSVPEPMPAAAAGPAAAPASAGGEVLP